MLPLDSIKNRILMYVPSMTLTGIIEIIILAFLVYSIMLWIKKTRAWMLLKGIVVILIFTGLISILHLTTIQWIIEKCLSVAIMAVIVILQPELRRALEQIGRKNILSGLISFDNSNQKEERFSDKTIESIIDATYELGRAKTGALIVIEQDMPLTEYINTGIIMDSLISVQLLIQIFEHNTPLHDGAIIIRNNRIVAATCYLPLSDNMDISKALGTRHRAALGISEVTDSLTIVASEETGLVSLAVGGELIRDIDRESLKSKLNFIQKKSIDVKRFRLWKVRQKNNERKADE